MSGIRVSFVNSLKAQALEKGINLSTKTKVYTVIEHKVISGSGGLAELNVPKVKKNGNFTRVFLSEHSNNWVKNLLNKTIFRVKTDIKNPIQDGTVYPDMILGVKIQDSVDEFAKGTLKPNHIERKTVEYVEEDIFSFGGKI